MTWLRARMHLFLPLALAVVLIALALNWALGARTWEDTVITALMFVGGLGLLVLRVGRMRRGNGRADE